MIPVKYSGEVVAIPKTVDTFPETIAEKQRQTGFAGTPAQAPVAASNLN